MIWSRCSLFMKWLITGIGPTNLVWSCKEWAEKYPPALLEMGTDQVQKLNDDRIGRSLDRLFDADRSSMMTEIVVRAVREFDLSTIVLHFY